MHPPVRFPLFRLAAAGLLIVLGLTACQGQQPAVDDTAADASDTAAYNDADIQFMRGMIPHHEQAVEMANLIDERSDRPEMRKFGVAIIDSQQAEIDEMRSRLSAAGEDPENTMDMSDGGGGGMDHGGHDGAGHGGMEMHGMMSEEAMAQLRDARGDDFDRQFLEMMIEHHEGAVVSSREVLEDGRHPEVARLAERIIDVQQVEIDQMRQWLRDWNLA